VEFDGTRNQTGPNMKDIYSTDIDGHALSAQTLMMGYGYDPHLSEGAVKPPVFLTSTFAFPSAQAGARFFDQTAGRVPLDKGQESAGLVYSRFNNPNMEIFERRFALYDGGAAAAAFSSGMAAISAAFLALCRPGDVVVHSMPLYGGTETLMRKFLAQWGVTLVELPAGASLDPITATLEHGARLGHVAMIYLESPSNPTNDVIDLAAISRAAHLHAAKAVRRPLIVCDNTMMGPVFCQPSLHGIDLTVYSLTKYVGGHSDLVAGAVAGVKSVVDQVRSVRSATGSQPDPHTCWMLSRSLETLELRMRYAANSASQVADWLAGNEFAPVKVLHPEYIESPSYQRIFKTYCSGAGSTFSFVVPGGRPAAFALIDNLELMKSAVSLGGTETLVCHPASTTHSGVSTEMRERFGVEEGLIRISIGLEKPEDLIADLRHAMRKTFCGTARAAAGAHSSPTKG
jgi:cystathionine beta-lyase/cystathionine gamma-synthase